MKSLRFLIFVSTFFFSAISAQKIGVVDTNYILNKLPQYKDAETRLNSQVEKWETEIQTMQKEYDTKKLTFENEKVLLVGDQLKERQKEIDDLGEKLQKTISSRFGTDGEINKLRANLTKPFQDQIWNAIKTVVEKNSLGIVLDKSNNISVLFLENRYDYTDKVLDLLLKNQPATSTKGNKNTPKSSNKSKIQRGNPQKLEKQLAR